MLRATSQLLEMLEDADPPPEHIVTPILLTITRCGSIADARALLPLFLRYRSLFLIELLRILGDRDIARELFHTCCDGGGLISGMPASVLHCIGYHGLLEARPLLWAYARMDPAVRYRTHFNPPENRPAVYGMLHLPCDDMRDEIEGEIRVFCRTDVLFPQYLPALAVKTEKPDLLNVLWERGGLGEIEWISGFILGIALYGEAGRPHFEELIWSPKWWGATDTDIFDGMAALGMSVADVLDGFRQREASLTRPWHAIDLVCTLLRYRIEEWHSPFGFQRFPPDNIPELWSRMFGRTSPHTPDSLPDLVRHHTGGDPEMVTRVDELEHRLQMRYELDLAVDELRISGPFL